MEFTKKVKVLLLDDVKMNKNSNNNINSNLTDFLRKYDEMQKHLYNEF